MSLLKKRCQQIYRRKKPDFWLQPFLVAADWVGFDNRTACSCRQVPLSEGDTGHLGRHFGILQSSLVLDLQAQQKFSQRPRIGFVQIFLYRTPQIVAADGCPAEPCLPISK